MRENKNNNKLKLDKLIKNILKEVQKLDEEIKFINKDVEFLHNLIPDEYEVMRRGYTNREYVNKEIFESNMKIFYKIIGKKEDIINKYIKLVEFILYNNGKFIKSLKIENNNNNTTQKGGKK